jgi:hypothetical protein
MKYIKTWIYAILYWGAIVLLVFGFPIGSFFLVKWIYNMSYFAAFLAGLSALILLIVEGFIIRLATYMWFPDNF